VAGLLGLKDGKKEKGADLLQVETVREGREEFLTGFYGRGGGRRKCVGRRIGSRQRKRGPGASNSPSG